MNFREQSVGGGNVYLIAGGGKIYTDVAARFVRSEQDADLTACQAHDPGIIRNVLRSGHMSALEFDWFVFAVDGYSRVCEAQLVRKRMASYMIKSGRAELGGNREFSVVWPESVADFSATVRLNGNLQAQVSGRDIAAMISDWYDAGLRAGIPEEDLRYMKPQATEFKGIVGMNAHALRDFFAVRCCNRAQAEIRDMANKMLKLCKDAAPELFKDAGPNCKILGYCPENASQCSAMRGRIPTKEEAMKVLRDCVEGGGYGRQA